MDRAEFQKLKLPDKAQYVFSVGKEMFTRNYLYFTIKCYSVPGFFAEIWYLPFANKIDRIVVLDSDDMLNIYDKQLDIRELLDKS
jgi:hypothetical protein